MASFFCHTFAVTKQVRLERIVRHHLRTLPRCYPTIFKAKQRVTCWTFEVAPLLK